MCRKLSDGCIYACSYLGFHFWRGISELVNVSILEALKNLFYQCCGSGMFIPDPGSWFLPIPDPGSRIQKQQQKTGVKNFFCQTIFCSHKFHKFWYAEEKIWPNFPRIIEVFTQKIVTKPSKIWVCDPGLDIRDPEKTYSGSRIPDPGVKKAPDPGSGSATLFFTLDSVSPEIIEWIHLCLVSESVLVLIKSSDPYKQCCGSGSTCFWDSWIRIH